ncbi:MAG: hypothetical protein AB7N71_08240, partial [Phycisphaerae bacterium]
MEPVPDVKIPAILSPVSVFWEGEAPAEPLSVPRSIYEKSIRAVPMAIGTGLIFHLHTPAPLRDTAQMATLSLTLIVSLFLADAPDSHLVTTKHGHV